MAFAADLVVSPDALAAVTTNQVTYSQIGAPPGKSSRIDTTSTNVEPVTIEISHRDEGSGAAARAVHAVTFRKKKLNTAGQTVEASVTVTYRAPKDAAITAADVKRGFFTLCNMLYASGAQDRVLRGEV